MDDMQAIEQRLTRELRRRAGPSEPVDDAAIFTALTNIESPKWRFRSMFSATKFAVAAAVAAVGRRQVSVLSHPQPGRGGVAVTTGIEIHHRVEGHELEEVEA